VVLKNGNRLQGEVIAESPAEIVLRFPGGNLVLKAREVAAVERESRLEYLLQEGEAFLKRGDPENALALYRSARQEDPRSDAARLGILTSWERQGELLAAEGRYTQAVTAYRELLEEAPDHPRAGAAMARIGATVKEGLAQEAEGITALKRGAVEEAARRLRSVYERFPERRQALAKPLARALLREANGLLGSGRLEEAEALYLEAASLDPDLAPSLVRQFAQARAGRISALADRGEFASLRELAEDGLRMAPGDPVLTYLAALGSEGLGRKREAAKGYLKVSGLDPPRDPARSIERLRKAAEERISGAANAAPGPSPEAAREEVLPGDYREVETEHFIVRHRNPAVGTEVSEAAEGTYDLIRRELDLKDDWRKKCTITIFPTQKEYQEATGLNDWTGGSHRILRKMGSLTDHRIYSYQTQPRLSSAVIPHEVGHAMAAFATLYEGNLPLWINEGFAIHWEAPFIHSHYSRVASMALRTGLLPPLARLLERTDYPAGEDEVRLFYAQCHTVTEVLFDDVRPPQVAAFLRELARRPGEIDGLLDRFFRIRGRKALENRWLGRLKD